MVHWYNGSVQWCNSSVHWYNDRYDTSTTVQWNSKNNDTVKQHNQFMILIQMKSNSMMRQPIYKRGMELDKRVKAFPESSKSHSPALPSTSIHHIIHHLHHHLSSSIIRAAKLAVTLRSCKDLAYHHMRIFFQT